MIVVDASVIVTSLADDGEDGDRLRERLRGERLLAPHLIDLEVVSAWRRLASAGNWTIGGRRSRWRISARCELSERRTSRWSGVAGNCARTSRFATVVRRARRGHRRRVADG
jgi:predicted nucleic acid-binding protein